MMKGGARLRLDLDEGWCETLHYITIHQKRIDLDEGLVLRKTDPDRSLKKDRKGSPLKKASLKKDSPSKKSQAGSSTDTLKKSSPHAKALKKDQELALVPVSEKKRKLKKTVSDVSVDSHGSPVLISRCARLVAACAVLRSSDADDDGSRFDTSAEESRRGEPSRILGWVAFETLIDRVGI